MSSASSPILTDVIRSALEARLSGVHTALPAQIVSYDYTKQQASVKPLIQKRYADGEVTSQPIIENVPVIFPRSGGASLTFPVLAGDTVLLIFSERSLDNWLSVGGEVDPRDARKFDLSDAIAIPGLYPFSEASLAPNGTDVTLSLDQMKITLQPGNKLAMGASGVELLDLFSQTLDVLISWVSINCVPGSPVTPNPATVSLLQGIKADLTQIKGAL